MTQRVLITSALPYINGVKHLGTLVGSMLPADVFARYSRARGRETLFICATDEHGTPAELAALEEGLEIEAYCTKWATIQKDLGERFGLSWAYWGRSSSAQNRELTVASSATYAPFAFENKDKQIVGFDIDIINAIAKQQGFKIKLVNTPWASACVFWPGNTPVASPIVCGAAFGVFVYAFMNLVVIPLSRFPTKPSYPLAILATGLFVHMFLFGVPIALASRRAYVAS